MQDDENVLGEYEDDFNDDQDDEIDELSKLIGVKPKAAAIVCGLDKVSLAAACALAEVPATCFDGSAGDSFAILSLEKTDAEAGAKEVTRLFPGLEVCLIVNRDEKLSGRIFKNAQEGKKAVPALVLFEKDALERYLIGASKLEELKKELASIDSSSLSKEEALSLLKSSFGS